MKIAFTSDLHLTSLEKNPERFHAFESILKCMISEKIQHLIIAGDLFDEDAQQYSDYEKIIKKIEYKNLKITIIRGNHDIGLRNGHIKGDNVTILDQPTLLEESDMGINIFLVPYKYKKSFGEVFAENKINTQPRTWILVGHGDWLGGIRETNPYEHGIYMPLTSRDLLFHKPLITVLGHIHKPIDSDEVCIPGSPCGLDISESGLRSFLIFNTNDRQFTRKSIDTDFVYFNESIVVLPTPDEESYVKQKLFDMKKNWGIYDKDKSKVILRLKINGYCSNPKKIKTLVEKEMEEFTYYKNEEIDFSEMKISSDVEKNYIAEDIQKEIMDLELKSSEYEPSKEHILLSALNVIFGK